MKGGYRQNRWMGGDGRPGKRWYYKPLDATANGGRGKTTRFGIYYPLEGSTTQVRPLVLELGIIRSFESRGCSRAGALEIAQKYGNEQIVAVLQAALDRVWAPTKEIWGQRDRKWWF